ncbi:hemerythrin domain-containing protein [Parvularcula oceani]|uniref:hemerythrin domain-containing protein n=1 Tax=Parvularcula oceani TaxID=1247963 RepID=UPI00068F6AD4|nr:hemerythrin domain-containing protein [Parvularcula oceani]
MSQSLQSDRSAPRPAPVALRDSPPASSAAARREGSDDNLFGGLLIGGLIGVVIGAALNPARKLALEGMEAMTGDWYDILKAEHHAVERAFDKLLQTSDDQTGRRQLLLTQIAHALNKHAITEENVIYPALRKYDKDASCGLGAEHLDIKTLIADLQYEIPKDDPRWIATARELRDLVVHHAREEEEDIFPPFRDRMSKEDNESLNRRLHWEGIKVA